MLVKYSLCERKWVYRWASAPSVVGSAAVIQHQLESLTLVYVTFSLFNHISCLAVVVNLPPTSQLGGTMTCLHSPSAEGKGGCEMGSSCAYWKSELLTRGSCWLVPGFAKGWLYLDLIISGHTVY